MKYLLQYTFENGSTVTYYYPYLHGPKGAITNLKLSCERYGIEMPGRTTFDKFVRLTAPGITIDFETIEDIHFTYLFEPIQMH